MLVLRNNFVAILTLALFIAFGPERAKAESQPAVLTTVRAIRDLSPARANERVPAEFHAVVTFYNPAEFWALFVEDNTGGIFVKLAFTNQVAPGDRVLVQGVTDAGDYAPMVLATNVIPEGSGPLPAPRRATFDELASGVDDGAWVQVEGVVRLMRPGTLGRTYMEAIVNGQRLSALVTSLDPGLAARLINETVQIRGVCYSRPNSRRQIRAPWLAVTGDNDIRVVAPSSAEPVAIAFTNLLRYDPAASFGQRVKVRGVVALQQPGRALFLIENKQGLRVKTQQALLVAPGDVVDVVGFPALGQYSPFLEDATFRLVGHTNAPEPLDVQVDQLLSDGFDAALVRLRAKLINKVHGWRDFTLVAQANNMVLNAHLEQSAADDSILDQLQNGSIVDLTGICALQPVDNWNPSIVSSRPQSFQLLLRGPKDVAVVTAPPWWTLPRLLWAVAAMSVSLLAGLAWLVVLDRRVRRQTQIIQEKAQREAVLEERSRIAREFHDTLEQELAAIAIQLDTVCAQFADSPAVARELLELTRNMSRRSLVEARRSVWDLRSHLLENSNLVTALAEVAKGAAAGSSAQIIVSTAGSPRKLVASLENNLLRLAQEALTNALKHARARRIGLQLAYEPDCVRLEIDDDGVGFDPQHCPSIDEGHFGLLDMSERVARMGGALSIKSQPGHGARIMVEVHDRAHDEQPPGELSLQEAI